jgi:NAD(P)-dependent dehydrogenase (short-subunit alcohol dehydrogenase family)
MNIFEGTIAVVTGGASGIGRAVAGRLHAEGSRVAVFDLDLAGANDTVSDLPGALALEVDVTDETAVVEAINQTTARLGAIDIYCSNAGVAAGSGLGTNAEWIESFAINTLSHVYAARAVLPSMAERSSGHFVVTASAGGVLMFTKSGHYTATKHAAVALAEWLAVEWGDKGIGVHCVVPGAVRTRMATNDPAGFQEATAGRGHMVEPDSVADVLVDAMRAGRFLVLSHPEIHDYEAAKVADRTVWLSKMRRRKERR